MLIQNSDKYCKLVLIKNYEDHSDKTYFEYVKPKCDLDRVQDPYP